MCSLHTEVSTVELIDRGHIGTLETVLYRIKDNLYIKDSFQGPNVSSIERFHCILPLN